MIPVSQGMKVQLMPERLPGAAWNPPLILPFRLKDGRQGRGTGEKRVFQVTGQFIVDRWLALAVFVILLLGLVAAKPAESLGSSTVVPRDARISHEEAGEMLLELLLQSGEEEHLSKAGQILDRIESTHPDGSLMALYRIRLEAALGNRSKAVSLTEEFVRSQEFDAERFIQVADVLASLGRYRMCREIYAMTLDRLKGEEKRRIRLVYSERLLLWGDYYSGEEIIREELAESEQDPELNLRLARNLVAQQRFEEARKHLQRIVHQGPGKSPAIYFEAWTEAVSVGLLQKDFAAAAVVADDFQDWYGGKEDILLSGARAYLQKGRLEDAQKLFAKAAGHEDLKQQALLGLARVEMKRDKPETAVDYLERAAGFDTCNPEAEILLVKARGRSLQEYAGEAFQEETDPAVLTHLAQVLAGQGEVELAAEVYRSALAHDPQYFEAGAGLAEVYGSKGRYADSLEILQDMLGDFPESYKLQLTRARVLGWSRQYEESLEAYDHLYAQNPDNHVVTREAARTAYWGKKAGTGDEYYQRISTPAVDEMLLERLRELDAFQKETLLKGAAESLEQEVSAGSAYTGYEGFFDWYGDHGGDLGRKSRQEVEGLRHRLNDRYVIQKQAELERGSKKLLWNERFAPARRHLQELVEHEPGNQESLFDLAQACCVLGLGDEEEEVYQELLEIDPLHGQASRALERRRERSRPGVFGNYSFWREKGRGELARMDRHRLDMGLEVPLRSRHSLRVTGHRYFESPRKHAGTVQASGISLDGELVTGPHFTLAGGLRYKSYADDLKTRGSKMKKQRIDMDDLLLGHLSMRANLDNYAALTLGYEKREELANVMALAQGIYSEVYSAELDVYPLRRLELGLSARYLDYSDNNHGYMYGARAGYAFTEHPRRFRTILSGEYRDTSRAYQGCPSENECSIQADFKYPYWNPENHWGSAVTFEFTHDLAQDFFCGAREHYYQLQLTLGTEKDKNHSVEIRGSWNREFENGLGINTQAMWHDSREWDAASLELGLFYRF